MKPTLDEGISDFDTFRDILNFEPKYFMGVFYILMPTFRVEF